MNRIFIFLVIFSSFYFLQANDNLQNILSETSHYTSLNSEQFSTIPKSFRIQQQIEYLIDKFNPSRRSLKRHETKIVSSLIIDQIIYTLQECKPNIVDAQVVEQCSKELNYMDDPRNIILSTLSKIS